jgi:hypothetical protein
MQFKRKSNVIILIETNTRIILKHLNYWSQNRTNNTTMIKYRTFLSNLWKYFIRPKPFQQICPLHINHCGCWKWQGSANIYHIDVGQDVQIADICSIENYIYIEIYHYWLIQVHCIHVSNCPVKMFYKIILN